VSTNAFLQVCVLLIIVVLISWPLGIYICRVMEAPRAAAGSVAGRLERGLYRACGIDPREMPWADYATGLLAFNVAGAVLLYGLQRLQAVLPFNPAGLVGVAPATAFNTAVSFATNTSWQSYSGETTLSHAAQMIGIASQSFLSAATGIAALLALLRGFARVEGRTVGNVWVDLTRCTVCVLLPLAALLAVLLVSQGSIQNLAANRIAATLESTATGAPAAGRDGARLPDAPAPSAPGGAAARTQVLPMGPVASQTAIALLSGDGGGFFNANSAHPYANPTAFSNLLEMVAILLIPAALCHTFGAMVRDRRQGWAIQAAMAAVLLVMSGIAIEAEQAGNAGLAQPSVDQAPAPAQPGGNMEGKETRFGIVGSALFAAVTTGGGDGAVNAMHDSFTPLAGMVPMVLMQLGEVIFGGPGSGLYGMLLYAMLAVFIAALMVGRAPEYVGKKIDIFEMKMISVALLVTPLLVLGGTTLAVLTGAGRAGATNPGAHGYSEILYAFSSTANNNGSAFAGLAADSVFYNVSTAIVMWFGRFVPIVAVLATAGSLAGKRHRAPGPGTLPTHGPLFVGLLIGTVLAVGALTYLPAVALGPVAEALRALPAAAH
jgi:K+-transporting ATPase ATPase A chain